MIKDKEIRAILRTGQRYKDSDGMRMGDAGEGGYK
jgi:hypothetical protein